MQRHIFARETLGYIGFSHATGDESWSDTECTGWLITRLNNMHLVTINLLVSSLKVYRRVCSRKLHKPSVVFSMLEIPTLSSNINIESAVGKEWPISPLVLYSTIDTLLVLYVQYIHMVRTILPCIYSTGTILYRIVCLWLSLAVYYTVQCAVQLTNPRLAAQLLRIS